MLHGITVASILIGILIMGYCILRMFQFVAALRKKSQKRNENYLKLYYCCLVMLIFFLMGYVFGFVFVFFSNQINLFALMVGLVFLFGAIFVLIMVRIMLDDKVTSLEIMTILMRAIEMKDSYTRGHSQHVYDLIEVFYEELPLQLKLRVNKSKLLNAAILHDLGKISIPDEILNKADSLTDQEWQVIKEHARNGKVILEDTSLKEICNWVEYHHERVDGTGYYAVENADIPLESKIIAIADTYSALVTKRVYRDKYSHAKAIQIIHDSTDTQFDPELVRCFSQIDQSKLACLDSALQWEANAAFGTGDAGGTSC